MQRLRHNTAMPNGAPPAILVVDDERAIADTVVYALRTEGFAPQWCATAGAARESLAAALPALVVLDVGLPDANGFDFCRELRARWPELPVIFLTARSEVIDRVVGLEIGGDDYLSKPFSPRELTARVKAVLRRRVPAPPPQLPAAAGPSGLSAGEVSPCTRSEDAAAPSIPAQALPVCSAAHAQWFVDEGRCRIAYRGAALELTATEFRLLRTLVAHPGRVYSRDQLMHAAWPDPGSATDRTVDAHVKTLRAKLRVAAPACDPIQTHRGLGYSLREET
ncbi:MAG TPA: response regulator [Opitutaceae bacterium]|nr:response regulator [Opitutaceae bacterium]